MVHADEQGKDQVSEIVILLTSSVRVREVRRAATNIFTLNPL